MFDFQMAEIQFRFAARQQTHARAFGRETHREPFSDSTSRSSN
jgi:hypothetical protein